MKFKKGDIIFIKSLEWYNHNKDITGNITKKGVSFTQSHSNFCGKQASISMATESYYLITGSRLFFAEWMFDLDRISKMQDILKSAQDNIEVTKVTEPKVIILPEKKKRGRPKKIIEATNQPIPKNGIKLNPGDLVIGWNLHDQSDYIVGEYIDHKGKYLNIKSGENINSVSNLVVYSPENLNQIHTRTSEKRIMTQNKLKLETTLWKLITDFQEEHNVKLKGKFNKDGLTVELIK